MQVLLTAHAEDTHTPKKTRPLGLCQIVRPLGHPYGLLGQDPPPPGSPLAVSAKCSPRASQPAAIPELELIAAAAAEEKGWVPWIRTRGSEGASREQRAAQLPGHRCIVRVCLNSSCVCSRSVLAAGALRHVRPSFLKRTAGANKKMRLSPKHA